MINGISVNIGIRVDPTTETDWIALDVSTCDWIVVPIPVVV
jgi:hypothetical protein